MLAAHKPFVIWKNIPEFPEIPPEFSHCHKIGRQKRIARKVTKTDQSDSKVAEKDTKVTKWLPRVTKNRKKNDLRQSKNLSFDVAENVFLETGRLRFRRARFQTPN